MAALLQESFLLPVHGDVVLPLHSLYQQHVTPQLEQLMSVLLDSSTAKASKQAQLADAKQLVSRCVSTVRLTILYSSWPALSPSACLQDLSVCYMQSCSSCLPSCLRAPLAAVCMLCYVVDRVLVPLLC